MRKFLLLLLVIPVFAFGQTDKDGYPILQADTTDVIFQYYTIQVNNKEKKLNFKVAKDWAINTFTDYKKVVSYSSETEGKMVMNSSGSYDDYLVRFSIEVDVKNNKYRMKFFNFSFYYDGDWVFLDKDPGDVKRSVYLKFKIGRLLGHLVALSYSKNYYDFDKSYKLNDNW